MPIASKCDYELGCTFVVWHGNVTPEEWDRHFDDLIADPAFPPGPRWIVDLQTADSDLFAEPDLAEIGRRFSEQSARLGGLRLAIVPDSSWDKARHLMEHEVHVPGLTSMQFATLDTACVWLGVDPTRARSVLSALRDRARSAPGGA